MNLRKFKLSEAGHMFTHYERGATTYSNSDVDTERSHLNKNYGPVRTDDDGNIVSQMDYLKYNLNTIDHVKRKDLVVMGNWIIDAPSNLPDRLHDRFFELSYDFMIDRYGRQSGFENPEDICISAYRHRDEHTDHMHFSMMPIKADENGHQRFIGKEVFNRDDLKTAHQDLQKYLADNGIKCSILNGKTKRDRNGRALSMREFKAEMKKERERSKERRRW